MAASSQNAIGRGTATPADQAAAISACSSRRERLASITPSASRRRTKGTGPPPVRTLRPQLSWIAPPGSRSALLHARLAHAERAGQPRIERGIADEARPGAHAPQLQNASRSRA